MATTIGHMAVMVSANSSGFTAGFATMSNTLGGFIANVGKLGAMVGITTGIGEGLKKAFGGFAEMESSQVAFETLLGSADKAKTLMADLAKFGAETPFQLPELTKAGKNLAAFGMSAEEIVPKLRRIGDIASLLNQPIGEMATLYGKAKVAGVLMSEDINQFTERGVPLIGQLAKQFGVAESSVKKLASEGKVSFADMDQALTALTSEGGRFAGGMEKQSQTLGGRWSTLTDSFGMAATTLGEGLVTILRVKDGLQGLAGVADGARAIIGDLSISVGNFVNRSLVILNPMAEYIGSKFAPIWNTVAGAIGSTFTWIKDIVSSVVGYLVDTSIPIALAGFDLLASGVSLAGTVISSAWNLLSSAVVAGAEVVHGWLNTLTGGTNFFADTGRASLNLVGMAFGELGVYATSFKDVVVLAFKSVQFVFENFAEVGTWVLGSIGLKLVTWFNDTAFLFTDKLPAVLNWFGENWFEIFRDVAEFTATVFKNIGKNIWDFITSIPELIAGTKSFADIWTPLTDGFKVTIKSAMVIPERQMSDFEKQASANLEGIRDRLAQKKASFFQNEMKAVGDASRGGLLAASGMDNIVAGGLAAGSIGAAQAGKSLIADVVSGAASGLVGSSPGAVGVNSKSQSQENKYAGAIEAGSKEAYNVILRSRDFNAPAQQTASATKELVKQGKKAEQQFDDIITAVEGWGDDFGGLGLDDGSNL